MKIREGFVSNSSSTSYLIGFKKDALLRNVAEILDYLKDSDGSDVIIIGKKLSEGYDIFRPTGKIRLWMICHKGDLCAFHFSEMFGIREPVIFWDESSYESSPLDELESHLYEFDSYHVKEDIKADSILLNIRKDDHSTNEKNADDVLERRYGE